jgi:hypothetical protein
LLEAKKNVVLNKKNILLLQNGTNAIGLNGVLDSMRRNINEKFFIDGVTYSPQGRMIKIVIYFQMIL